MKRFLVAVAMVVSSVAPLRAGVIGPAVRDEVDRHASARVVVALRDLPSASRSAALRRTARLMRVREQWERLGAFSADLDAVALAELERDPDVLRVDLDVGGQGGDEKSLALIGGNIVAATGYKGDGITVAILDTGINLTHPDLAAAIVDQQCFCTNADGTGCCPGGETTQSGPGSARDDHGHGTNIAGIIASQGSTSPRGLAPGVKLIGVRVMDANNSFADTAQVLSGLNWVLEHHPETRVINASLGTSARFPAVCDGETSYTIAFARAIDALKANGTLVFVSSGNDRSTTTLRAPACVDNAMAVGAVHDSSLASFTAFSCTDAPASPDQVACFSNGNATLDLLGPGVLIRSTGRGSATSTFTGTSMAAPHAAALAAILFAIQPTLTADAAEAILESTGKPLLDSRNGVTTPRIDAFAAVQRVTRPPAGPKRRSVRH